MLTKGGVTLLKSLVTCKWTLSVGKITNMLCFVHFVFKLQSSWDFVEIRGYLTFLQWTSLNITHVRRTFLEQSQRTQQNTSLQLHSHASDH